MPEEGMLNGSAEPQNALGERCQGMIRIRVLISKSFFDTW